MFVTCNTCGRVYDDAARWTICPHSPLGCAVDDLCPKCDTLQSVHGPCPHQLEKLKHFDKSQFPIFGNDIGEDGTIFHQEFAHVANVLSHQGLDQLTIDGTLDLAQLRELVRYLEWRVATYSAKE